MSCEIREFAKRQTMYTETVNTTDGDRNWPSTHLTDFLGWIGDRADEVPIEFRSEARIYVEVQEDYAAIRIGYYRPETDEEMEARAKRERARLRAEEVRERDLLAVLLTKYGAGP